MDSIPSFANLVSPRTKLAPRLVSSVATRSTNECPAFFDVNADAHDDKVSGGVSFFIGIVILFVCLFGLVKILQKMLMGMSTRIIYKATDMNGYIAMIIGAGITSLFSRPPSPRRL